MRYQYHQRLQMTTIQAAYPRKHTFLTFYVPWSNLSGAYVPEIYEQYTNEYIELSKNKHQKLAEDFGSDYIFIDNLRYCKSLFQKYNIPMIGFNDIFNIKFMLFEEYFNRYDSISYIDFDVVQKGTPTEEDQHKFLSASCGIHYVEPMPGYLIHDNVTKLCNDFNIKPNRDIWQNNNGVITINKDTWLDLDYLRTVREVYNKVEYAEQVCDETMFNFATMYNNVDVQHYEDKFNTLVRRREEFDCHEREEFRMFHFTKHTGKDVLNEELRNPLSILY